MRRVLVTRHPGTVEWARRTGLMVDEVRDHLGGVSELDPGDVVVGTLPIPLVAALSCRGVVYVHLDPQLRPEQRGRELAVDELAFRVRAYEAHERSDVVVGELLGIGGMA